MRHSFSLSSLLSILALTPATAWGQTAAETDGDWLAEVRRGLARSEYTFTVGADEIPSAPNRAQGLRSRIGPGGVEVFPRHAGGNPTKSEWSVTLALATWGRIANERPVAAGTVHTVENRVNLERGSIVEWYVNGEDGLEQGFTVTEAPSFADPGTPLVLAMRLATDLGAVSSADRKSIRFRDAKGHDVLHYRDLFVFDATGRELPAALHVEVDRVEIRVDDRAAEYPVTVDPLFANPVWSDQSNQTSAHLGASVYTAGDVNGDGYSDVVVGAPDYDTFNPNDGHVWVFHGSPSGVEFTESFSTSMFVPAARFGASARTAGDVNGDGFDDLIVGEPGYTNGLSLEGRAHLFLGSPNGITGTSVWQFESNHLRAELGTSVSSAGDVNNDGFDDVILGAPGYDALKGRAYVFLGAAAGLSSTPDWTADGLGTISRHFGFSVSTAGDITGDGFDDVIIGAPLPLGLPGRGQAFVYYGEASGLSSAGWSATGTAAASLFGWSVSTAGDTNADGLADVVIGEPDYTAGQTSEGRIYVVPGSLFGPIWIDRRMEESNITNVRFGYSVGTAGDVNGDAYADVVVGAPANNVTNVVPWAYVFHGTGSGIHPSPAWQTNGGLGADFGACVGPAGDVNGDGFSDVMCGSPDYGVGRSEEGAAWVWLGSGSVPQLDGWNTAFQGTTIGTGFGNSTSNTGDFNGDGYSDLVVAAPFESNFRGVVRVYYGGDDLAYSIDWQQQGTHDSMYYGLSVDSAGDVDGDGFDDLIVGAPFFDNAFNAAGAAFVYLGSANGLATTPAWTVEGAAAVAKVGYSVAGAGDVNGDGFGDVIVGVPEDSGGPGKAHVYLGGSTGLDTTPTWTHSDPTAESYGESVDGAGDVNGDGFADVLVGAPNTAGPQFGSVGRAYLFLGSSSGVSAAPDWMVEGAISGWLGQSVSTAGDVNGDGLSDVIIGAPIQETDQADEGRVFVYLGHAVSGLSASAWIVEGNAVGAWLGHSVSTAGDVNGDGFSDIILGAPRWGGSGRAQIHLGSASGLSTAIAWSFAPPSTDWIYAGESVTGGGDANGDGFADVLVGMPTFIHSMLPSGRTGIFYGNGADGRPSGAERRPGQKGLGGSPRIAIGGIAAPPNAFQVVMTGRSAAGRDNVVLEWEVRPLGQAFNGSGAQSSPVYDTGFPSGAGSVVPIAEADTSLLGFKDYHWRARLVSRNPLFPRTPWFSAAGNNVTEIKLRSLPGDSEQIKVGDKEAGSLFP